MHVSNIFGLKYIIYFLFINSNYSTIKTATLCTIYQCIIYYQHHYHRGSQIMNIFQAHTLHRTAFCITNKTKIVQYPPAQAGQQYRGRATILFMLLILLVNKSCLQVQLKYPLMYLPPSAVDFNDILFLFFKSDATRRRCLINPTCRPI